MKNNGDLERRFFIRGSKGSKPFVVHYVTLFASFVSFMLGALLVALIYPRSHHGELYQQNQFVNSYYPNRSEAYLSDIKSQQIAIKTSLDSLMEYQFENKKLENAEMSNNENQISKKQIEMKLLSIENKLEQILEEIRKKEPGMKVEDFMQLSLQDLLKSQSNSEQILVADTTPPPTEVPPKKRKKKRRTSSKPDVVTTTAITSTKSSTKRAEVLENVQIMDPKDGVSASDTDLDGPAELLMGFSMQHNMTASDFKDLLDLLQKV